MNQKLRTRAAIIEAGREMLRRGEHPTVAQAAEAALVSRTTAYRYFPTQESLLTELTVSLSVDEIEELVSQPSEGASTETRLLEFVEVVTRHTMENEALHRGAIRHYMDLWFAGERTTGGHDQTLREGRRLRWISAILGSARDSIEPDDFERLKAALSLLVGGEAMTVLRDVCHLETDDAVAVVQWAADSLLQAALARTTS